MIIEREAGPVLHRQKCHGCGYYTFYRAVPAGDRATDTCTYCGHETSIAWNSEVKSVFKNTEKLLRDMREIFPELDQLREPGDHVLLEE